MATSYHPFNEPQVHEPLRQSGKVQALVTLLFGFGLGCGAMYVAVGQPSSVAPPIDMAWTQPAQASRFTQQAKPFAMQQAFGKPFYPAQPAEWRQPVAASASQDSSPEGTTGLAQQGRREIMTGLGFLAAGATHQDQAAHAVYGDSANVFGKVTNSAGFYAYAGEGFSMLIPSKWVPSNAFEFSNVIFAYEDNFDAVNKMVVVKKKGNLGGSPEEFLQTNSYLLGQQSYAGETISEGGFAPDRVSAASVLDVEQSTDKKGRKVYTYNILSRTADGNEGGRHQLIKALDAGGTLYILKIQVGDKRWFKGVKKEAEGALNSFTVA